MANNKRKYTELAKAQIQENRKLVISSFECWNENKGFTLAQQIEVEEKGKKLNIFLKDGIHTDIAGLYEIRDACNLAIAKYTEEKRNAEVNEWDDEDAVGDETANNW